MGVFPPPRTTAPYRQPRYIARGRSEDSREPSALRSLPRGGRGLHIVKESGPPSGRPECSPSFECRELDG
jgi:hypothetical protein